MKKCYQFLFTVLFFFAAEKAVAQNIQQPVRFAAGNFTTGNTVSKQGFSKNDLSSSLYAGDYFVLVQFNVLPSLAIQKQLKNSGLILGSYIPGNAYLTTIKNNFDISSAARFNISSINNIPSFYKIDKALYSFNPLNNKSEKVFAISFFPTVDKQTIREQLQQIGVSIIPSKFEMNNIVFIDADKTKIDAIAKLPFVSYIGLQSIKDRELNYNSTAIHGVSSIQSPSGRGLSGKGVAVGVGDNSELSTAHVDFTERIISRVPYPISFHGIHVAGTVAGGGLLNPLYKGMAPRATIVNQWFSDIITNTPTYVADHNMIATCNSYTAADDGCPGNGVYDALSNYADDQMRNYETVLHVFAAGNDGTDTCGAFPGGFSTIKTGWQCAKNVITVGAMNQADYKIAFFSSRGPVNDGRIKPEIVACGYLTLSTRHFNGYEYNSGTSMAAPVVTGVATLLNERYRQLYGATPKASLIKALMCNTAEDMGNKGPDYTWGFGMLNARRAVEAMENNQFFINNTPTSYPLSVPAGVRRLKVMLYWADPAAAANAGATLINDLDLTVTDPVNGPQLPLVLNPLPAKVDSTAKQGADHTNNIEQVVIDNPGPGNYSLNVSAFSLPQGPQEYILTYQMDMNGVTVEYPFGGETWVPGETESIRWSANGGDGNTFTVEYSDNNGSSWTVLSNNVPDTARSYNWVVSATPTNNALIRVSRNSTAFTDQSDNVFTVLGQPVLTSSIPCEGYVQLNWGAITGATSYDIMQVKGDTMTVIANTTSTSYLVEGLNGTTQYMFAVRAKNNTTAGRRSVAVLVTPTTGTCSLAAYTNNMKAVAIVAPVTGRQFTSSALTASAQVKFTVKNLDDVATSGSYDLSYQVNGGAIVTETSSVVIAALGSTTYSFTPTAAFATTGVYNIKAWVKRVGDNRLFDDTTSVTIKNLDNSPVTLPLTDGFETTTDKNYIVNTIGLDGDDRVDFKTNATRGRARTFVNSGFPYNGTKAITLDQFPVNAALVTDSLLMTYNASSYNGSQLRFDFYYNNHGQANNPNNKVWIRGSDTSPWILAYDLVANQAPLGQWKHAYINVNDVLDTVLPAQPISTSFQIKFAQQGTTSANNPYPLLDQDDGYTFDDVTLTQPVNDIAITQIVSPAISGCNVAGSQPISLKIKNYTATTFTNVPVTYVVNGGTPVTQTMASVVPGEQTFTFASPVSFAANTDYTLDFWLYESTDTYRSNDSLLKYTFHTSPLINTYPYLEGFENNDGNWYTKGTNDSWQWGTPAKSIIDKAANGTKAWVTGLTTNYKNNELSYLYSPCFDLTSLTQPVLSFSHIFRIEDGTPADYNWAEYSTNGGVTWNKLGTFGSGINWYNDPTGASQWRTSMRTWHVASIDLPVKSANMRFRIVMSSDLGINYDGVGIDDIHIFDKAAIYNSTPLLNTVQNVSGSNWVHFTDGTGKRIASINANGQNLGNTTVDVYPYTGSVRTSSSQYYLNRNIVVKPTTPPVSNVTVRFYFTDAEAKSLIAATGCGICSKPKDPYELGVTKYSGLVSEENGTLNDNLTGIYSYITPANTEIIPYDNGYYAEFSVNSFSEFWLNNGGLTADVPLPVNLLSFEVAKQNRKSLLQWSTSTEINTNRFSVERSADGRNFTAIGTTAATNHNYKTDYNFTDAQPLTGLNYYRLKIIDNSGAFTYSPIRRLNFSGDGVDVIIYPNPVNSGVVTISASNNCNKAILYDAAGKQIKAFVLQGRTNTLNVADVAKGVYQLKIFAENGVHTEKIVLQ